VIGGGNEALKRVTALLNENCKIIVISHEVNKKLNNLALKKKIQIKKKKLENADFLTIEKPFIIITTTDNKKLNSAIIKKAKKLKIIAYSSDDPEQSDYSNPSTINIENTIEIAIFTGGKSPVMSKKIREQIEKTLKKTISRQDLEEIKIQQIARTLVKSRIGDQNQRKDFLNNLTSDKKIKQLIKDGQSKKIEKHIIEMLRNWK